jgi:hypothetical protein
MPARRASRASTGQVVLSARQGMSARIVARTLRVMNERGVDPAAVLAQAGIERDELTSAHGRVPYALVNALVERLSERVPAAELGLAIASAHDGSDYGPAGLLLLAASTFRKGLESSIGYQRIWGDGPRFEISNASGRSRISFRHPGNSPLARAVLAECALAEVMAGARVLVDSGAVPEAVEFVHAPFDGGATLAEYFGLLPSYQASSNSIVFGSEIADRPMHVWRDLLSRALEEQCRRVLDALPEGASLAQRVQSALKEAIEHGPTLSAIARRLKMNARTLQRRLSGGIDRRLATNFGCRVSGSTVPDTAPTNIEIGQRSAVSRDHRAM